MSDPADRDDPAGTPADPAVDVDVDADVDRDHEAVRRLVKRAFSGDVVAHETPDILRGVQRRLRRRSRGKFFADGWSTSQARQAYVLVALVTLLLVAMAYYALSPVGFR
ncbi:MAG: hypothetical protein JOZ69_08380 [Myxococcales bacterium]|nr:hypothetical protein [Myxococcales bacterium]